MLSRDACLGFILVAVLAYIEPGCTQKPTQVPTEEGVAQTTSATPAVRRAAQAFPLVEFHDTTPLSSTSIFPSAKVRGLKWWGPGSKRFLCVAISKESEPSEDPERAPARLEFYEMEAGSLVLRYRYDSDEAFLGFGHLPTRRTKQDWYDENLLVAFKPERRFAFVGFGLRSDKIEIIWEGGGYDWPELADIDGDDVEEIIDRYPRDVIETEHSEPTAYIYRELQGAYRLVAGVPYDERLQPRDLSDRPLSE